MRFFSLVSTVVLILVMTVVSSGAAQSSVTCDSFANQSAAQLALNDDTAEALDPDGDGVACESLPASSSPFDTDDEDEGDEDEGDEDQDTRSADITDQEQEYFDALDEGTREIGDATGEIGSLFQDAADDPTVIFDQDWTVDLATQFFIWQEVGDRAQTLDPSLRQQPIHDLWLEINRLTTLAVDDYIIFIDELDPLAATTGTARVTYASVLTDDLTAAINAFNDDPNSPVEPEGVIAPVVDCEAFDTFAEAQQYYSANPEEQSTIDPNFDGRACEVFFGE